MIERFAAYSQPLLHFPYVRRTRRNHGLEHATIHILTRMGGYRLSGRSSDSGFVLFGEVPTEKVQIAAYEALTRMKRGEHNLAVHPNCGTNLVTAGALHTLVALVGLARNKRIWDRIPTIMLLMIMTTLVAQPLGMSLQKHITTEGDPGDMDIVAITRHHIRLPFGGGPITVHRVNTRQ